MSEQLFEENVQLWQRTDPRKAVRLQFLNDTSLKTSPAKSGVENLITKGEEDTFYFHDQNDPIEEAEIWFNELKLKNITVIYVYGIGLGHYYNAAVKWLKEDSKRGIIFLENNLEVIHAFLHTKTANRLLKDPQAYLCYFESLEDEEETLKEIYWDFILTQMTFSCLKSYSERYHNFYLDLKHHVIHGAATKNAIVEEYLHYGTTFFTNYYQNMLLLSESWKGTSLYGKFENIPAIICGAGPSLEKNILQLKDYLDKAIVFGGGSALNALSSRGIVPHFGIGVDPNPTQQYRLSSNKAYEVPLFYRNRMHYEAFRLIHGPRLYIPGAGGYEIADWFDEQFGLKDEDEWLDEGHNVVNFGLELANNLGCNPIIFVGVDLAFTEMQSYASGIIDDTTVKEKDITETDDFDTTALLKEDIYGRPIYTLWKWISESEWTTEYAKEHPNLTIINSTEGGLGMPNIPNMPLKEAAQKYLIHSFDLRSRVQGEILNSTMPRITDERVLGTITEMHESLKRSVEHIQILLDDRVEYEKKLENKKEVPEIKQSGLAALAETELEEEPAYEFILGIFNLIYSRVLNKDLQLMQQEHFVSAEWQREINISQINRNRLNFMNDVALVNIEIITKALEERTEQLKG
ncbi:MAG: 6-hydroxymethylpterin diphosphokinase MptE-like protein [Chlamydiota bacterium]